MRPDGPSEAAVGVKSPEIGLYGEGQPEEGSTILDWLKASYQPPPVHPITLHAFELLGLQYIPTFEVDEEVPLFNIGRRTDDLRFEMHFFLKAFSNSFIK